MNHHRQESRTYRVFFSKNVNLFLTVFAEFLSSRHIAEPLSLLRQLDAIAHRRIHHNVLGKEKGPCYPEASDSGLFRRVSEIARRKTAYSSGVPNLSLTMYPFSILTDEHVPLTFLMTIHFIMIIH